jgi:calcineurin-like phosphoesterase family protein
MLKSIGMTYFTSDLHFGDEHYLFVDSRPFKDIEDMDQSLILAWQKTVKAEDDVFVVGDLISHNRTHDAAYYLSRLPGHLHLIVGNHDHTFLEDPNNHKYFESIDQIKKINLEDKEIILCHYPMAEWENSIRGSYHIYGHIHAFRNASYQYMATLDKAYNCGCMICGYRPVTFEELVEDNRKFRNE